MANRRIPRINEQLRREISELLQREVKDPRIGAVTITAVRTTADLDRARVFVSVPAGGDRDEALAGLAAAAPFMRGALGRRMQIRRVPELHFEVDESLDHALRIERLLDEVRPADDDGGAAADGAEGDDAR